LEIGDLFWIMLRCMDVHVLHGVHDVNVGNTGKMIQVQPQLKESIDFSPTIAPPSSQLFSVGCTVIVCCDSE